MSSQAIEFERAKIRAGLMDTPGALRCEATLDCQVITQGGPDGLRAHQMKVHFNDEWLRGDDGAS